MQTDAKAAVEAALNPSEIEDPTNVLRLALFEERITRANVERQFKRMLYDMRVRDIKNEAKMVEDQLKLQEAQTRRDLGVLREELEARHGIKLNEYGYDEVTGKLTKLPPDAVTPPKPATA
jgi:hypothetical protein